jgi:hypothetical protein
MPRLDVETVADVLMVGIKAATAPLAARVAALEAQLAALGPGPPGPPGTEGPMGPPGAAGAPGSDGTSVEALTYDGERTLTFTLGSGESRRTVDVVMPLSIHRGVFVPDRLYERGDNVTHQGSTWIAQCPTSARPGPESRTWQLACKAGRDLRDKRLEPSRGD